MFQNAGLLLTHTLVLSRLASAANTVAPAVPVTIRECNSQKLSTSLFPPFAEYLTTQPTTIVPPKMGIVTYQFNSSGSDTPTCLEVHIQNWSCDRELSINGAGLANAVQSIADQCQGRKYASGETAGPTGFGYYKDLDTKEEFGKRLWVITGTCGMRPRRSACTPGV